jgi:hypothetical protein
MPSAEERTVVTPATQLVVFHCAAPMPNRCVLQSFEIAPGTARPRLGTIDEMTDGRVCLGFIDGQPDHLDIFSAR